MKRLVFENVKINGYDGKIYREYNNYGKQIMFKAETIKGEIIEACCVINKHDRLLLSNEAKAGFWIECKPDTLQVINKKQVEQCLYCGKSSCNGDCY